MIGLARYHYYYRRQGFLDQWYFLAFRGAMEGERVRHRSEGSQSEGAELSRGRQGKSGLSWNPPTRSRWFGSRSLKQLGNPNIPMLLRRRSTFHIRRYACIEGIVDNSRSEKVGKLLRVTLSPINSISSTRSSRIAGISWYFGQRWNVHEYGIVPKEAIGIEQTFHESDWVQVTYVETDGTIRVLSVVAI